jgi:hypothetical protein
MKLKKGRRDSPLSPAVSANGDDVDDDDDDDDDDDGSGNFARYELNDDDDEHQPHALAGPRPLLRLQSAGPSGGMVTSAQGQSRLPAGATGRQSKIVVNFVDIVFVSGETWLREQPDQAEQADWTLQDPAPALLFA